MSSHHVVREKQEPALLIANGEGCSFELLGQLLEWSPFIVVLDHAIHRVLDLGIKVDVLLGILTEMWILTKSWPDIIHWKLSMRPTKTKPIWKKALSF